MTIEAIRSPVDTMIRQLSESDLFPDVSRALVVVATVLQVIKLVASKK